MSGGLSGPAPKHQSVRARANKASTRATLTEPDPQDVNIPPLPPHTVEKEVNGKRVFIETPWHPLVIAWWAAIWPSPMASEWHESDIFGLYAVAFLYHEVFCGRLREHPEMRQARIPFGLTPLDRRRLEWTIENVGKVTRENRRVEERPIAPVAPKPDDDIRLRVV